MSKVYLAEVLGDYGKRCLIGDGKMLKFNFGGDCLGEYPIDYNLSTMQEVDVVSVLVSSGSVEVGYNINQNFSKKTTLLGLAEIASKLNKMKGLIFLGKREEKNPDSHYIQYIYTFIRGSVTPDLF